MTFSVGNRNVLWFIVWHFYYRLLGAGLNPMSPRGSNPPRVKPCFLRVGDALGGWGSLLASSWLCWHFQVVLFWGVVQPLICWGAWPFSISDGAHHPWRLRIVCFHTTFMFSPILDLSGICFRQLHSGATEKMRCFNRILGDWSVSQVTRSLERSVAGPSANVKFMISEYFWSSGTGMPWCFNILYVLMPLFGVIGPPGGMSDLE